MQEYLLDLYQHFQANRIETHMYASQWFLTIYTAKFPLSIVFRILDIYLCEVICTILSISKQKAVSRLKFLKSYIEKSLLYMYGGTSQCAYYN